MASSSFLHCLSSTAVSCSASASASASGLGASTNSSTSPRAYCLLIKDKLTDHGLPTSKPRSLVWPGRGAIQTRRAPQFAAALQQNESQQNESHVGDEASLGSNGVQAKKERQQGSSICPCRVCGRRGLVASLGVFLSLTRNTRAASASSFESSDYNAIREAVHPPRPEWYEELYAQAMAKTTVSYEREVADYKRQLFRKLDEKVENILELGIGTGPNLKYYGNLPHLQRVIGVDPNLQMAKYCADSVTAAGLSDSQFEFLNAVGEGIPVPDESMDAVVCTLTLCSVSDVTNTLEEIKRVLRPGGSFVFVEHVAAPEGTGLRFWQDLLDPLQQWVADGCHLTRDTLQYIDQAQFGSVQAERFSVESVSLFSPHVRGIAYK